MTSSAHVKIIKITQNCYVDYSEKRGKERTDCTSLCRKDLLLSNTIYKNFFV